MSVTFEHVSADIQREPQRDREAAPAEAASTANLNEQLEQALRLKAEREARICDR
jgi:hypothetical protein